MFEAAINLAKHRAREVFKRYQETREKSMREVRDLLPDSTESLHIIACHFVETADSEEFDDTKAS